MLGADKLADIAYGHEMQSKAGNEDYVTAHWSELEQEWRTVLETFKEIYEKYSPVQEETGISHDSGLLELPQEKLDEADKRMAEIPSASGYEAAVYRCFGGNRR